MSSFADVMFPGVYYVRKEKNKQRYMFDYWAVGERLPSATDLICVLSIPNEETYDVAVRIIGESIMQCGHINHAAYTQIHQHFFPSHYQ